MRQQAYKPGSVAVTTKVATRMIIHLGPMLPPTSSYLPGSMVRRAATLLYSRIKHPSQFDIAPDGVYPATDFAAGAVSSYLAISTLPYI